MIGMPHPNTGMANALHAAGPAADLAGKLALYGRFVGSWVGEIESQALDGAIRHAEGEWHFGWVLDGRAIQDVWIFPSRRQRDDAKPNEPWFRYGTTFRWYDPSIDAWHITWFDPSRPGVQRQIGRAVGDDIVQIGEDHNGLWRRWRFVDIAGDSFRWIGHVSWDRGDTWTPETEMRLRRA